MGVRGKGRVWGVGGKGRGWKSGEIKGVKGRGKRRGWGLGGGVEGGVSECRGKEGR